MFGGDTATRFATRSRDVGRGREKVATEEGEKKSSWRCDLKKGRPEV